MVAAPVVAVRRGCVVGASRAVVVVAAGHGDERQDGHGTSSRRDVVVMTGTVVRSSCSHRGADYAAGRVRCGTGVAIAAERLCLGRDDALPFAEYVCLTLITQKVSHGWALGTMLAPDGELGRIWSLSRPLTYRAIDGLVDKGLITRSGQPAGRGRDRVLLAATPSGRRLAKQWLDTPVEHLRDVRTELLIKLALRERAGLDNDALLATQQQLFEPTIDALTSTSPDDDLVDLWRRESARAVRRFLDQALHPPSELAVGPSPSCGSAPATSSRPP